MSNNENAFNKNTISHKYKLFIDGATAEYLENLFEAYVIQLGIFAGQLKSKMMKMDMKKETESNGMQTFK